MDGNDNGGGDRRDFAYSNRIKDRLANIKKESQAVFELAKPFREDAREQIQRALPEGERPVYQRAVGFNREILVKQGELMVAGLARAKGSNLEDQQVQAVADSLINNARSSSMMNWACFGITLYFSYKHRRPPPKVQGRIGALSAYLWPPAVFFMYSIPMAFLVKPIFATSNAVMQARNLQKDPRLSELTTAMANLRSHAAESLEHERSGGTEGSYASAIPTMSERNMSPTQSDVQGVSSWSGYSNGGQSSSASPRDWGRDTTNQEQAQSQEAHSGWGDDDASPIAPSSRRASASDGLSSWDRIRNQTIIQQSQGGAQDKRPGQARQTMESWDDGSSSARSFSDSDASQDKDKNSKERAQRDFDRLLDRERQGQDRGSWSRG